MENRSVGARRRAMRLPWAALLLAALTAGCASLPREGPDTAAFVAAGAATEAGAAEIALVAATPSVAATLAARDGDAPTPRLIDEAGVSGARLAVGDTVSVAIFEPTAGGAFSRSAAPGQDGGQATELPSQRVDDAGAVVIPFAGSVRVAGLDPAAAARRIEAALAGQAVAPQVVVSVGAAPGRAVTVLGDAVAGGGRVPLQGLDERVLDVVAAAGGLTQPIHDTALRLTRGAETTLVPLAALLDDPRRNVRVRPGDVIAVEHAPRRFTVLGAVTQNAQVPFGQAKLSLQEALAKSAGLLDERADPAGVFVVRYERPEVLAALPVAAFPAGAPVAGAAAWPTAYQVDLADPVGVVTAMGFPMRDGDLIYVANARITPTQKTLGLFAQVLPLLTTALLIPQVTD